jgi:hypothetical protein
MRQSINAYIDCHYQANNNPEDSDDTKTPTYASCAGIVVIVFFANLDIIRFYRFHETEDHDSICCHDLDGLVHVLGCVTRDGLMDNEPKS